MAQKSKTSAVKGRNGRGKESAQKSNLKKSKMKQQAKNRAKMMEAARNERKALGSVVTNTPNLEKRRTEKTMLLRRKKKSRKSGDQELMEKYGAEIVDLTDPSLWGDFEEAYETPTGARERNKMLKKAKNKIDPASDEEGEDEGSDGTFDDDSDGDGGDGKEASEESEDEDVEAVLKELKAQRAQDGEDLEENLDSEVENSAEDEDSDEVAEDAEESDEGVEEQSEDDLDEECDEDEEMDSEEESEGEEQAMPFRGPLAPGSASKTTASRFGAGDDGEESADEAMEHEQDEEDHPEGEPGVAEEAAAVRSGIGVFKKEAVPMKIVEDEAQLTAKERKAVKNWELFSIHNCILKALAHLNYTEPTEIQSECLTPAIRDRLDILGAAETGSGKTLAFGIPLVNRLILDGKRNKIGALILTPTRELAVQIRKHLIDITKFTSLHVVTIVGGLCHEKQMRLVRKRPEIIVATPGRLYEILQDDPSFQEELTDVRFLVIDEADRMIQEGHFEEMQLIVKFMNRNQVGKRQNLVFSATLTMDPHLPERVMEKKKKKLSRLDQLKNILQMPKPRVIDLSRKIGTAETLTESRIFCEKPEYKDALLYYFVSMHPGRTLVFCNSIDCVRRLKSVLEVLGLRPMALHAEMQQRQRLRHLDKFAAEPNSLLIATDVAARGLDIKNVEHVIHFNVSKASETYIHRSGRTARVKQAGLSIMLVDGRELPTYRRLLQALKRTEDLPAFPLQENILRVCRARVEKARELEMLRHRQRKRSKTNGWFVKCAEEAGIELDEDLLEQKQWTEDRKEKVKVEKLQVELRTLMKKPLIPLNQRVGEALNRPDKDPLKVVRGAKGLIE